MESSSEQGLFHDFDFRGALAPLTAGTAARQRSLPLLLFVED
jgi:hypothetical protein